VRASESDRTLICPASLVLPRTPRERSEKTNRAAAFGTLAHHWVETGETAGCGDPRDVQLLEEKIVLSGICREDWWSDGRHEVSFAINLLTGEVLDYEDRGDGWQNRDDWKASFKGSEWLTGTIDYLYENGSVDDLKTGAWKVDPATSGQLRSYALYPWMRVGMPLDWRSTVSITSWPKYPKHAPPTREYHELTGFDLLDHLEDLRWAATHPDEVNPSDEGCRYCDAKPNCPAWADNQGETDE
jgi:hypothetical protein